MSDSQALDKMPTSFQKVKNAKKREEEELVRRWRTP